MSKTEQQEGMPTWRKSRYSVNNGSCAEVAAVLGTVMVRDSVGPSNVQLRFASRAWRAFIAQVKAA
jgi:hypothetical protein